MNDRINVVSSLEVKLKRYSGAYPVGLWVTFRRVSADLMMEWEDVGNGMNFDPEAQSALKDILSCMEAGHDFNALKDTDPRPYVGKVMQFRSLPPHTKVKVTEVSDRPGWVLVRMPLPELCAPGHSSIVEVLASELLGTEPLVKVRPYTPAEATEFMMNLRALRRKASGTRWCISSVRSGSVRLRSCSTNVRSTVTYRALADEFIWLSDGKPCGVVEQP